MPGTIFVSVIDFLGFPDSSSTSTLSIKVSMGKKEYQTWDKGELSFPLMTFRETLHVVVQDKEGNVVSCAGIETKSIVERGVWDDIFPLEGGGQVHMKLRFVLTEDEKNRIRVLRESAVKKNRRELLDRRTSGASFLSVYSADKNDDNSSMSSSLPRRKEVNTSKVNLRESEEKVEAQSLSARTPTEVVYPKESALPASSFESAPSLMIRKDEVNASKVEAQSLSAGAQTEAAAMKVSSSSTSHSEPESSPTKRGSILTPRFEVNTSKVNIRESIEKVHAQSLSARTPDEDAYTTVSLFSTSSSESESSSEKRASLLTQNPEVNPSNVNLTESVGKTQAQSFSARTPTKASYLKEASSSTSSSESIPFSKKASRRAEVNPSKVNPAEAQSTKAAFSKESSSSSVSSSHSSSSKKRASLERTPSSVKKMISAFESNLSPDSSPRAKPATEKREPNKIRTELRTEASKNFKELTTKKSREQELNITPNKLEKEETVKNEEKKSGDFTINLTTEASLSAAKLEKEETVENREKPSGDFTINLTTEASLSAEKSSNNTGLSVEDSEDISVAEEIQSENMPGSPSIRSSMDDQEDIHSSIEISGAWIFPDHHRRFCVTTGGTKMRDLMEGQSMVSFAIPQKDHDEGDNQVEIERTGGTFEAEKLQPEIKDVEPSRGVIQQMMKVTIMVGFGFLVLFTRQRNKR